MMQNAKCKHYVIRSYTLFAFCILHYGISLSQCTAGPGRNDVGSPFTHAS